MFLSVTFSLFELKISFLSFVIFSLIFNIFLNLCIINLFSFTSLLFFSFSSSSFITSLTKFICFSFFTDFPCNILINSLSSSSSFAKFTYILLDLVFGLFIIGEKKSEGKKLLILFFLREREELFIIII